MSGEISNANLDSMYGVTEARSFAERHPVAYTRIRNAAIAAAVLLALTAAGATAMHFTVGLNGAGFHKLWAAFNASKITVGQAVMYGVVPVLTLGAFGVIGYTLSACYRAHKEKQKEQIIEESLLVEARENSEEDGTSTTTGTDSLSSQGSLNPLSSEEDEEAPVIQPEGDNSATTENTPPATSHVAATPGEAREEVEEAAKVSSEQQIKSATGSSSGIMPAALLFMAPVIAVGLGQALK